MERKTAVVIGAVNMDICGRPNAKPRLRDSNPGVVSFSPGGVGRNIAHNLCLLGLNVKFVAAIGNDVYGQSIYSSCLSLGMDMSLCRRLDGMRTSSYLYVTDENNDMLIGVSDTDISASITPEYLKKHLGEINSADAVVIDANLTAETLSWIADNVTRPLYADPVSAAKSSRLLPAMHKLTAFKPNEYEAMSLTDADTPEGAAKALLSMGVKRAFVSLGRDGVIAAEGDELIRLPCVTSEVINTTGCGDAATAAMIWSGVHGLDLRHSAEAAMRASAMCAACPLTVNPDLSAEKIK